MRFYQKIRFRLIVGAVLLVLAVAGLLLWRIQGLSEKVLEQQEYVDLFDETNLRFREMSAEIQALREDVVGLVNVPSVRTLQWAIHFERKWLTTDPRISLPDAKARVEQDFADLLKERSHYRRIEYYLHRTLENDKSDTVRALDAGKPVVAVNHKDFPNWKGLPLAAGDVMIKRAEQTTKNISFSRVKIVECGTGAERETLLQACLPVAFAKSEVAPGLVVITVDCKPWAKLLTRSPRHLVFMAGGAKELLLYPQPGRPAYHVLRPSEADTEEMRRFRDDWLTRDDGSLEEDPTFKPTFPVKFRYAPDGAPDGQSDAHWKPTDLEFRLLRFRVHSRLLNHRERRDGLNARLNRLRGKYPNLVLGEVNPAKNDLLIRAWPDEVQKLHEIRDDLEQRYGADLEELGSEPLRCTQFVRTLYKFSLGPSPKDLPEQCLYIGMAAPRETIDARIDDNRLAILKVTVLCVLGAIGLAVLGSILLTRRLNAITAATQELAAGKADVRLPVRDKSEIGVLARSFAYMVEQIQQRQREIARHNAELEQRVKERTRELEAANAELADARDRAEQASVAKDFFLATVSHELRTPLNHVIGFIQLLEMTELDDDQQRDLGKIQHAADNLLALVNDLLDYQKIVQGALTLEPARFAIGPWVEELADAMRPRVAEKGNRLVVDCPADVGEVDADEKRVRQALTNLLSNAAKFTANGVVTVRVRRERDAAGGWLRLDVQDTGRGLTQEQQKKLFQPFTKLLSRSENPEGTGLGLALSQRLCRLMGGDLTLSHSEPGAGSTFTIRLPSAASGVAAPLAVAAPRVEGASGAVALTPGADATGLAQAPKTVTVLVIDDDPDVRELMRRHLEGQGFVVHEAASGAEGLEMVKRVRPDAITLDVLMPGIDGWATLAALQADAETAHIPVIMITMLDDRTRGFALGAWEVLPKPVSWSRLIDLLRHVEPGAGPVLLVDDDPAMRELAGRALSQHGWDVCCAADGKAGLAAAARRRPALVLLDLLMPVMDGFEFLEVFRKEPAWRDVPVVVLTAKDLTDEERRRLGDSAQRVLVKGMCGLDEVLREVEWLLRNQQSTPRLGPDGPEAAAQSTQTVKE
jgi:signal transduction histidine kinase/DNA-binding response OmpR family regulator